MPWIEDVWSRIRVYEGEKFRQIRGGEFTYAVTGNYLVLDRTNQRLSKSSLEEALTLVPLQNTVPAQHLRGPSYIYAILMDERIRQGEW